MEAVDQNWSPKLPSKLGVSVQFQEFAREVCPHPPPSIGSPLLDTIAASSILTIAGELEDSEAACNSTHGPETTCHFQNTIKSYYPPTPHLSAANNDS
jgi:hypothetical protein